RFKSQPFAKQNSSSMLQRTMAGKSSIVIGLIEISVMYTPPSCKNTAPRLKCSVISLNSQIDSNNPSTYCQTNSGLLSETSIYLSYCLSIVLAADSPIHGLASHILQDQHNGRTAIPLV